MKDRSEPVATALCNHTQPVAVSSVAVHPKSKISATGCGLVASQKGQKTGPDRTLKHYVRVAVLKDPKPKWATGNGTKGWPCSKWKV